MAKDIQYKNHTIRIYEDYDAEVESPRDWDNIGVMVCFHRSKTLGDDHDYKVSDFNGWDDLKQHLIKKEKAVVILPIYMYSHSGDSVSTEPFSCPFDSGQIGYIYTTREKILEGRSTKRLTKKLKDDAAALLRGEVSTYNQWMQGEFYAYVIDPVDEEDTCGPLDEYCGDYWDEKSAEEDARATIDRLKALEEQQQFIKDIPLKDLPKYINHEWKYPYYAEKLIKERFNKEKELCPTP